MAYLAPGNGQRDRASTSDRLLNARRIADRSSLRHVRGHAVSHDQRASIEIAEQRYGHRSETIAVSTDRAVRLNFAKTRAALLQPDPGHAGHAAWMTKLQNIDINLPDTRRLAVRHLAGLLAAPPTTSPARDLHLAFLRNSCERRAETTDAGPSTSSSKSSPRTSAIQSSARTGVETRPGRH